MNLTSTVFTIAGHKKFDRMTADVAIDAGATHGKLIIGLGTMEDEEFWRRKRLEEEITAEQYASVVNDEAARAALAASIINVTIA